MALADNLLNYLKLDESSGNPADSGPSNDTFTNTGVSYVAGKINNAAEFGTTGKKLQGTVDDPDGYTGGYSWSVWAYKTSAINVAGTVIMEIPETASWGTCLINLNGSDQVVFKFGNGEVGYLSTNTSHTLALNTWTHIVTTVNGTNQKCYINGTLTSNVTKASSMANNGTTLGIGLHPTNLRPFIGYLDEIGIWGRELTQTDVDLLYNSGNGRTYPLVASRNMAALGVG